jgi:hypothetical protein
MRMTDEERQLLEAALDDLIAEEADQQEERGHASSRLLRAAARLRQLLDPGPGPDTAHAAAQDPDEQAS